MADRRPIREIICEAVEKRDSEMAGKISVLLRKRGLSYHQSYAFVNRIAQISVREWDGLLYESDRRGM